MLVNNSPCLFNTKRVNVGQILTLSGYNRPLTEDCGFANEG